MVKAFFQTEIEIKVLCAECRTELEADLDGETIYVSPCPNRCKDSSLIEDEEEE